MPDLIPDQRRSASIMAAKTACGFRSSSPVGLLLLLVFSSYSAVAEDFSDCGEIYRGAYGPFDYTNPIHFSEKLPIVERAHFTSEVESFEGHNKCGGNGCQVTGDIEYTLHAFPNHHRALLAMTRYHIEGSHKKKPMIYLPECWFERAMRFTPQDGTVRMIYGYYLSKIGNPTGALQQYEKAVEMMPNSAEAHYNVALLYAKLENFEAARTHAHRAYELGFPLPGLRRKLERAGQWVAPESAAPVAKE